MVEDREIDIEEMIRSGRNALIDSAVEINNGIDVVTIQNPLQVEAPGPLATSRWGYGISASSAKHAFRRYRLTWLRKNGVPKDLERLWMGHASEDVGDLYSKLKDDAPFRGMWCEKVGLGFSVVSIVPQVETKTVEAKVA